jgi:glycosyltransferase involved in cell wall biosynthesis
MKIAMVGTRGVPARYGGFETAIEEIGQRLAKRGHDVVVYCRGENIPREHLGMRLVTLPAIRSKAAETLSHTAISVAHLARNPVDVTLLFNAANAIFLPAIRSPTAVHVDGLEWQRAKWGRIGRRYYLASERLAVRWADALIADARGIEDYYRKVYGRDTRFIPYGAPILPPSGEGRLAELDLRGGAYHLVVARFEPENHVDVIIRGYVASKAQLPLVVVGSAPYAGEYIRELEKVAQDPRVRLIGAVWDQALLDDLYRNCASYLHGHSVGGTNPSLLRAMGAGAPVICWDVPFSREVADISGCYFKTPQDVASCIEAVEADHAVARRRGEQGRTRASVAYRWEDVADAYEKLCSDLAAGRRTRVMARRTT